MCSVQTRPGTAPLYAALLATINVKNPEFVSSFITADVQVALGRALEGQTTVDSAQLRLLLQLVIMCGHARIVQFSGVHALLGALLGEVSGCVGVADTRGYNWLPPFIISSRGHNVAQNGPQ